MAQTTITLDETTCGVVPLDGTWESSTDTCIISQRLTISADTTLKISDGVTLRIEKAWLDLRGTMINEGSVQVIGGAEGLIEDYSGEFNNHSTAHLTNHGTIEITGGAADFSGWFNNYSTAHLTNNGTIEITGGAGIHSGQINNVGTINNNGTLIGHVDINGGYGNGTIFNYSSGTINNACGSVFEATISDGNAAIYAPCSPEELLEQLIDDVEALNLHQGIDNSLDAKLEAASQALADLNENNDAAAVNALQAFINAVEAQSGNKIDAADAATLIADAQAIIDLINAG